MSKIVNCIKNFFKELVIYIKEEKYFILSLVLILIIFLYPVDYYIITGGGARNISKRVNVEEGYDSKGSFNMTFVSEIEGTLGYYLLSYVIPGWERDKKSNYMYVEEEDSSAVQFRSDLGLKESNSNAIYWAYKLAGKKIEEVNRKIYVTAVDKDSVLKAKDQILSIDGKKPNTIKECQDLLSTYKKNDTVSVEVKRGKSKKVIDVTLKELDGRPILGVLLESYATYKTEPEVEFKFKSYESGPSAGLVTTLEIYNQLTKKDLTKSLKIAGTGTIEEDGSIGEIGGVEFKIKGAVKNKMDIFLVPAGDNYKEAKKVAKSENLKIKIISVKNIEDALEKIKNI